MNWKSIGDAISITAPEFVLSFLKTYVVAAHHFWKKVKIKQIKQKFAKKRTKYILQKETSNFLYQYGMSPDFLIVHTL